MAFRMISTPRHTATYAKPERDALMKANKPGTLGCLVLLTLLNASAGYGTEQSADIDLPTVVVLPSHNQMPADHEGDAGERRFDRRYLDAFAAADGGIEQLLKQVPAVQFSDSALSADAISDIRPESMSISGGRYFANRFSLDGLGTSNQMDPIANDGLGVNGIPSHEQSLFIDSSLIEELRVFDSNIPIEHSGFTGGVIDVQSTRPRTTAGGNIAVSGTRSDWANYRVFMPPIDPDNPLLSSIVPQEPQFERYRAHASYHQPLSHHTSALISVSQNHAVTSDISLQQLQRTTQDNTNLFLKLSSQLSEQHHIDVAITHAPYEQTLFLSDVKDSDILVTGGGQTASIRLEVEGKQYRHDVRLGYSTQQNQRDAPNGFYNWQNTRSREWGRLANVDNSREGGYGQLERAQHTLDLKWIAKSHDTKLWMANSHYRLGLQARNSQSMQQRAERLFVYNNATINSGIECRNQLTDCVPYEQYFVRRTVYDPDRVTVSTNEYSIFSEQRLIWRTLDWRFGIRLDHDDFFKNLNLAPRSALTWDVGGNHTTRITLGANRYYGAPLLAYRLREAQQPFRTEVRGATSNVINEWEADINAGRDRFIFNELRTPYSDELSATLKQTILDGQLSLSWTQRKNHDELARTTTDVQEDGFRNILMNNQGKSEHQSVHISWEKAWNTLLLSSYVSWSETRTNSNDYDTEPDPLTGQQFVYFQGRRLPYSELTILRDDFSRPIVANIAVSKRWSPWLESSINARYRASHHQIRASGRNVEGDLINHGGELIYEQLPEFIKEKKPATLMTDLIIKLKHGPWHAGATVHNLFNERTRTVQANQGGIEVGRYYWLEMGVLF